MLWIQKRMRMTLNRSCIEVLTLEWYDYDANEYEGREVHTHVHMSTHRNCSRSGRKIEWSNKIVFVFVDAPEAKLKILRFFQRFRFWR